MKTKFSFSALAIVGVFLVGSSSAAAKPQSVAAGTAFTYQGRLVDGGLPANGAYDFTFKLFDADVGGSQVAGVVSPEDVPVADGLFTVQLDFGAVYDGSVRFLEIGVRPGASTGAYTILGPRQRLDPTPYALNAFTVPWSGLTGTPRSDHNHWDQTWSGTGTGVGLTLTGGTVGIMVSGDNYGLYGSSTSGVGANGISTDGTGVSGTGNTGVEGVSNIAGGAGVYGSTYNGTGNYAGLFDGNVKVNGNQTIVGNGTTLTLSGGSSGVQATGSVYGVRGNNTSGGYGVYGTSTSGVGVVGSGPTYGVYGTCTTDYCRGVGAYASGIGSYAGYFTGDVYIAGSYTATGTKSAAVQTQSYGTRALYAVESPENWFEDFGTGQLTNGKAVISIDPVFAQTVNLLDDYHVFLTALGNCPIYVEAKSATSFSVSAFDGGTCSTGFDYRIVAKRLGYEDLRLAVSDQAAAGSVAPTAPAER